ncbi:hypothetical protein BJY52DRAFT_42817 [Lactarius psammicola]|nr:hypothetical protein BJY52DRAFT_42817 [Lactarius psammicola]
MDTWPPSVANDWTSRKGKGKAVLLPYPLLEGGALTSATLRERHGRLEWVTAQNLSPDRQRLVCSEKAVLAFPATWSPPLHPPATSWSQRAEQSAHFLRTYYPDVDVPAKLIREQVATEARLDDSLRTFDPLLGDLVTSFDVLAGSKRWQTFMAFPMGESGCDLNFSSIEFSAEGNIVTEPIHSPARKFRTPICQIVPSPVSDDLDRETVIAVRTQSSVSLLSLSSPVSRAAAFPGIRDVGSWNRLSLDGHMAVDVQFHCSLKNVILVNNLGHVFRHALHSDNDPIKVYNNVSESDNTDDGFWRIASGDSRETCFLMTVKFAGLIDIRAPDRAVKVYSVARASKLLTSIDYNLDDHLLRLVTTNELVWVDPRFHTRPVLALKHEREYDRTLSSHVVSIGNAKLTVLSSRNNSLLSIYDVSDNDGLVHCHTLPYSLPGCFPSGPHSGFCVVQPHLGYGNNTPVASLLQLSNRGAIYQSALTVCREETQRPAKIEVTWPSGVHRLNIDSRTQKPDVGRLGAREMQEVDFRQAYLRLFSPLDTAESIYPAENADAVYQTLDAMPLFWKEGSITDEHLLTTFDIAFRSGEEPAHASRADFLTQSTLSSRRGFRALAQVRVPRETLIKEAGWHVNLEPVLRMFVPDLSCDVQSMVERLHKYDLVRDECRSGSSLRRESEAREQLAVDLALSMDVFSAQPFAKSNANLTEDDRFETMSRAAEAMTFSETGPPPMQFGHLSPIAAHNTQGTTDDASTDLELQPGVRLLLAEWETGTDPDQFTYHDPYDDQQPVTSSPIVPSPLQKHAGKDQAFVTQSQRPPVVAITAPPVIADSRAAITTAISTSQPAMMGILIGSRIGAESERASDLPSDLHATMASTQCVPGPYGGRPPTGKKKIAARKKRVGGF